MKRARKDNNLDHLYAEAKEIVEDSLVDGTDNIYIKEKKYILPIENLRESTYNIDEA